MITDKKNLAIIQIKNYTENYLYIHVHGDTIDFYLNARNQFSYKIARSTPSRFLKFLNYNCNLYETKIKIWHSQFYILAI